MIKINKVNKYFNRHRKNSNHVINNTSLVLEDTGLVALLGPSGSGKTTLLNAIGGLDKIDSGSIYIDDKKISSRCSGKVDKIRNLNIGYIFQDYKLVDSMSVYDNVALSLKTIGIKDKKEIDKRVTYVLECVGMYRYRKRPASMLSGGERQRVGIARAIVKNPHIIIADEPTGNLDSKNSLEIMNIIKKISEDRLVVLVTHEVGLAKFYASRIIEIEDGKIINDYKNEHNNNLDYTIDNNIYLKDIENAKTVKGVGVDIYRDKDTPLNIEIVLKGNNIFIKSKDNRKIEVVDENSSIEFINDHFKTMEKKDLENIKFDFNEHLSNDKKLRYSSIFNPVTFISNGFKKVMDYSILKKLLLIGFFLSGFFVLMSASRMVANLTINDEDFVKVNKNYLSVKVNKYSLDDFNKYSSLDGVDYILPGDSNVTFTLQVDDYYQTSQNSAAISGSLSNINMINSDNLVLGRMPENDNEIVIDAMIIRSNKKNSPETTMLGLIDNNSYLNRKVSINNMDKLTIVGIVDLGSPSIYTNQSKFMNILYNYSNTYDSKPNDYQDYNLFKDKIEIKEGRLPENDYEVMVNISYKDEMKLNKEISKKINDHKLTVVGYYDSEESYSTMLVNPNMIKILVIQDGKNLTIYSKDKDLTIEKFRDLELNIQDSYSVTKKEYLNSNKEITKSAITSSIVVLAISLIEIILMLRSSFLSRIKEVGIYRAIGLKKKDIYIMFCGEIIAITTFASIPGVLFSAYIFKVISGISYLKGQFIVNVPIVIGVILLIFIFNLICGLAPVFNTLRKRPAQILARTDIE